MKLLMYVFILLLISCGGQSKEELFFSKEPDKLLIRFKGFKKNFYSKWPIDFVIQDPIRINKIWHGLQQIERAPFARTKPVVWKLEIMGKWGTEERFLSSLIYTSFQEEQFTFRLPPNNKYKNDNLGLFLKEELEISFIGQLPINKDSDEWETIIELLQDAVKHDREIVMPD